MQSDREKQIEYNLTVLRRRDQAISEIKDMAGHVVLYQFNEDTKAWDRKGVEGSLFVVERTTEPKYMFVVLNRLSSENLVETVDANFQLELTEQFLLYRNLKQEILGIWFYSSPERTAISELLNALASADAAAAGDAPGAAAEVEADGGAEPQPDPLAVSVDDAAPDGNVAQFFNMVQMQATPPPMPAGAATAAELSAAPPPVAEAAFDPAGSAPAPTEPAAADPQPPQSTAAAPPPRPPVDMEAVKAKLSAQLRGLLDDDAFLTMLANEYLRQQQRAIQQAQQQRQQRGSSRAGTASKPPPSAETAAASVPAHLAALMAQQASI
eukprot:CAMPEP_0174736058 /NCGR_PEP_ID=MMETSP1094-20130205/65999_1 /TAXON_ID=156173 /ORGANISM="Chrysochromulina brevifilum, Strain UTEX LB 985" /LENGTH=324 /DNA_ID=CAMNT_0015939107 /DNA_START=122 /DNA_END=1096 /DNA_ORIENTATION=-